MLIWRGQYASCSCRVEVCGHNFRKVASFSSLCSSRVAIYFHFGTAQMFRNTFQSGLLSLFYSLGNKPLQLWEQQTQNGFIRLVEDDEIQSAAIEVVGSSIDGACIRSIGSKAHFGHKATLFGARGEEHEKILCLRSGIARQRGDDQTISSQQFPIEYEDKTVHMHNSFAP
ncbi:hypothetical protein D918_05931 [Trichuris suis]|nr:hypothetical protein D918_05931 [Trichuris suis]